MAIDANQIEKTIDCINKRGYKTMMKTVLKSFKLKDVNLYYNLR